MAPPTLHTSMPSMFDMIDNPQDQAERDAEHDRMAKEYDDKITALAQEIVELRAIVDADISTITPTQITATYPSPAERAYVIHGVKMAQIAKIYQRIDSAQAMGELSDIVLNRIKVDLRLLEFWLDDTHSGILAESLCSAVTTPQPPADQAILEFREKQARARKILDGYSLRRHEPEITIAFGRADATLINGPRG